MGILHVVGLGPSDIGGLPLGTYQLMRRGLPLVLRTTVHPAVADLAAEGIAFQSFDDIYEESEQFAQAYRLMADRLLEQAAQCDELIYAVPGHPLVAEQSVQHLLHATAEGVEVRIGPGQSFLDVAAARLGFDPIEGLLLLDGTALADRHLNPSVHTLIAQVYHRDIAGEVKLTLMEVYPDDYLVTVIRAAGVSSQERMETVPLYELDRLTWVDHLTTVYVPPARQALHRYRDLFEAIDIVRVLRSPDGCPWDKAQTHASLRPYVLEEAYEVAEAIDRGDTEHLCEELGDLALQILLHARIAQEHGDFTVRDVFAALADKLVRRHPHVFGGREAATVDDVNAIWAEVKASEPQSENRETLMSLVSLVGPAFTVATNVQKQAAKVGFDWQQIKDVLEKAKEEMTELEVEISRDAPRERCLDELGDLLFTCVSLSRWFEVDAEALLLSSTRKFMLRFDKVEAMVQGAGKKWRDFDPDRLNELWNRAKIE